MSQAFIAFARAHGVEIDPSKLPSLANAAKLQDRTIGVYAIVNATNGHFYVGSSIHVGRRAWTHLNHLRKGRHHSVSLQRAFAKYGEGAFTVAVLARCLTHDEAISLEQRYLDACYGRAHCYNASNSVSPAASPEMHARAAEGRRKSSLFIAHAKAQMALMQTPEAKAASAAASRASPIHWANCLVQGQRLRALLSKPVIGRNVSTGKEQEFPSASAAMRQLGGLSAAGICKAVKTGRVAYGHTWRAAK